VEKEQAIMETMGLSSSEARMINAFHDTLASRLSSAGDAISMLYLNPISVS